MANARYDKWAELITAAGAFSWTGDTIKAALVSSTYTFSQTHQYLSDLGANRLSTDQTLGTKTATAGKLTSAAATWSAVAAGGTVKAIVVYKDTGVAGSSPLVAYFDTDAGGGVDFPVTTNGGDITYTPDSTNGWVKI